DAQRCLEPLDLKAERGLRDAQAARRAAEVQLFSHRHEVPEVSQLELVNHTRNVSIFVLQYIGQSTSPAPISAHPRGPFPHSVTARHRPHRPMTLPFPTAGSRPRRLDSASS